MIVKDHICVCICTYKREKLLRLLLEKLAEQITENLFTMSIIVVDNDKKKSALKIVNKIKKLNGLKIIYGSEIVNNIPRVRNKAIGLSNGKYIALIDDDEIPRKEWLITLYKAICKYKADGVLGPVVAIYDHHPPEWVRKSRIHDKNPKISSGAVLKYKQTRTSNVLINRECFNLVQFDEKFDRGGEDVELFRNLIQLGKNFVWSKNSVVYEVISKERCRITFLLKRAFLRGQVFIYGHSYKCIDLLKSLIACPLYFSVIPLFYLLNVSICVKYSIKFTEHIARFYGLLGIEIIKQKYVYK